MVRRRFGVGISTGWWLVFGAGVCASPAAAQCADWAAGDGYPSVAGPNASRLPTFVSELVVWDPDASGPLGAELVALGSFSIVGTTLVNDVAAFDLVTAEWRTATTALGLSGITARTTLANGDEVVARGNLVERWDGTAWTPLGITMNGTVRALATLSTGDVVAGGDFTTADGIVVDHVARWNGTAWLPVGGGTDAPVHALVPLASDAFFAGGAFTMAGGSGANRVALWDGVAWQTLGSGTSGAVEAMTLSSSGPMVVAGSFLQAGGTTVNHIATWDGVTWAALGTGLDGPVSRLFTPPGGDLLVEGSFTMAGGIAADTLARWDGTTWSSLGAITPLPGDLVMLPNGDLVTGGNGFFPEYGPSQLSVAVQRWDGTAWRPLGAGIDHPVRALARLPGGDVVAGGDFTQVASHAAHHVARFDGSNWSALGGGVDGAVHALQPLANGDLVAGGDFADAGGVAAERVARWDGTNWSPLGTGVTAAVRAFTIDGGGDLVAGGEFPSAGGVGGTAYIAGWDGTAWQSLGGGADGPVRALATLPNGDVVAGGAFTMIGGVAAARVARWNGTAWSPLGTGTNGDVQSLLVLGNGDLIAGGSFTTAGGTSALHIARWNGSTWSAIGAPPFTLGAGVAALAALPDGDLVAADFSFGSWVLGQPAARLLRWNGATWSSLDTPNGRVHALLATPAGELAVGGSFTVVDGAVSAFFARYVSTCPASAAPLGLGCPSSGGDNELVATSLPWIDATFTATASGLPDPAAVVALVGFAPIAQGVLPVASLLPEGVAGCDVLVDPIALVPMAAMAGSADLAIFLPGSPPLVGMPFYVQAIPFELDAFGAFVAVTATNSLSVVAGDF